MNNDVAALFVDDSEHGIYPALVDRPRLVYGLTHRRDARTYDGPHPVVAHPPCNLWVNMAAVNYARAIAVCERCGGTGQIETPPVKRLASGVAAPCSRCLGTGRREPNRAVVIPAWYPGGSDGGCFAAALAAVRRWGGVLEHPAGSHAWAAHYLVTPGADGPGDRWAGPYGTHAEYNDVARDPITRCRFYWVCEVWQSAYGHLARKRTWLLYCGKRPPFELRWGREPGTHQVGWFDRNKPTLSKREASATPRAFAEELIRLARWSRRKSL